MVEGLSAIVLFKEKGIRRVWSQGEWWFSVVDVITVLTDSANPQIYWRVLKKRLLDEGNETVTNCNGFKMEAPDGKMRMTDAANTEQLLRLVQSIPSPKAEPFHHQNDYAILTAEISKATFGLTPSEYKTHKNIPTTSKENLRDHMTDLELIFTMLGERVTTEISAAEKPEDFDANKKVAKRGGKVAGVARKETEKELGRSIISKENYFALEHLEKSEKAPK